MKLTATKPPKRKVSHLSQKNRCSIRSHLRLHINRRRCHTKRQNCLGAIQNRLQFILIRHSDLEIAPSKSIPEKYNRHTQQIVNHATQLDKKLFKLKCPVQSINTSSNIKFNFFQNMFYKLSSRTKNKHDRATEQRTPFFSNNHPLFSQHE